MTELDVLVVGAGLSGLVAARVLQAGGLRVLVVDKGRSVGGRLATRRIGDARLDHGAQFFTVRGEEFAALVDEAKEAGVVYEWCDGFDQEPDGHARHAATGGMNALAKWLAVGVDVQIATELHEISSEGGTWVAGSRDGSTIETGALLLTAPVPQSMALLDAGGVTLDAEADAMLRAVRYFKTIGLLATLDRAPAVPEPGGVQLPQSEPFTFVADNQRKGISDAPAITLHANHQYSEQRYDDAQDEVLAELLDLAVPWIGAASVQEAQLKKWRYAGPISPVPDPTVVREVAGAPVAFAGDAFGGPKVEGAFNSGHAAGTALTEVIGQ